MAPLRRQSRSTNSSLVMAMTSSTCLSQHGLRGVRILAWCRCTSSRGRPISRGCADGNLCELHAPTSLGWVVLGAPAGADVILLGGNFASADVVAGTLHLNPFGVIQFGNGPPPPGATSGGFGGQHVIIVYNDTLNNAHIADLFVRGGGDLANDVVFTNAMSTTVAVSDLVILVGVNADSLTGDNIHFVT